MRLLSKKECKNRLIKMLEYLDELCRKNNIKYSIIGGTAIGALRHKGFIPWDDDIDIILLQNEYEKLKTILINDNNPHYRVLYPGISNTYYFPGMKLVDKKTSLKEDLGIKIDDYGLFIDILCYNSFPDNKIQQKIYLLKNKIFDKFIYYGFITDIKNSKNIFKIVRKMISNKIGIKKILTYKINLLQHYNNKETKYLYSCWPVYSLDNELQERKNFSEYMDIKFENINVMITKNYDEVLTKTFGNYMEPPPKENRRSHNLKVFLK